MNQSTFQAKTHESGGNSRSKKPRLLMLAMSCDPDCSMEDRNGWHRALKAARDFRVVVFCGPDADLERLNKSLPPGFSSHDLQFVSVPLSRRVRFMFGSELCWYRAYKNWHWQVYKAAKKMHREDPFLASTLVSICGFREPGFVNRLGIPFVWGPIGGTSNFPLRFAKILSYKSIVLELIRTVINYFDVRFKSRVRQVVRDSYCVIAANSETQTVLHKYHRRSMPVELETGIDYEISDMTKEKGLDSKLRLLWAGRLRGWKAFPILAYALAKLPSDVDVAVKVVGDGECESEWRKLCTRLKVDHLVEFVRRPPYRESLQYYENADAFIFTSMRDTSGTGLLEALAAGTPIIGVNHQGAKDIMSDDSSIRVSVDSFEKTVGEMSAAIERLSRDRSLLRKLSQGARKRAKDYQWSCRNGAVDAAFASILGQAKVGHQSETVVGARETTGASLMHATHFSQQHAIREI